MLPISSIFRFLLLLLCLMRKNQKDGKLVTFYFYLVSCRRRQEILPVKNKGADFYTETSKTPSDLVLSRILIVNTAKKSRVDGTAPAVKVPLN